MIAFSWKKLIGAWKSRGISGALTSWKRHITREITETRVWSTVTHGRLDYVPPSAPSRSAWPARRWDRGPRTRPASRWGSGCPGWALSRGTRPRSPLFQTCFLVKRAPRRFLKHKRRRRNEEKHTAASVRLQSFTRLYQSFSGDPEVTRSPNLYFPSSLSSKLAVLTATTPSFSLRLMIGLLLVRFKWRV